MVDFDVSERKFEEDIEEFLINEGGYVKGTSSSFDRNLALDKKTLISFIKNTQPKSLEKLKKIYGEGIDIEENLIKRFCNEVKSSSLLKVLRHGFTDRGVKIYVVYFKPQNSINEKTVKNYESNIFTCTRQLHYSIKNQNSIDIVLFLNGIPIVSMELKCNFTGQDTYNAINQYKFDRKSKDKIFSYKERVFVHFAVDLHNVYMTTKLNGNNTYFLPFNQGSNGAGNVGGKGNPLNKEGYDTSYLWEKVLLKDSLLEIIQKYLHLEVNSYKKTETLIFPRFHQLDVVTKLLKDVKENGSGKNYLIQHSAGSGKSNSIAWLAYRLSGLHNENDEKIFKSVIIVTDRRVLDSQLQNTVLKFEHVEGLVQKIDKSSQQLKEAIELGTSIIITTLQKFPVIYKEVNASNKKFAVIIDEAHSSQSGKASQKLKVALSDKEDILKKFQEMENEIEDNETDEFDKITKEISSHGTHENLSFFAFTATPKEKTLNLFGLKDSEGRYHPFHIYCMRQAIEEKFILDVLKNYMTYKMYYKIAKAINDDPELDTSRGVKAICNYQTLHPHNISQKTSIMLEHFCNVTLNKISGRAKAMLVTSSRLHAIRYVEEFKRQIKTKGYKDLNVLVAFSGEIEDNGLSYTEEKINTNKDGETIKEKALPQAFESDEFGILIVAEKYQTGFDQPLLHTMFVDKKLSGVKAVQTLSRLNRTTQGKNDTFVLDFVNSSEEICKSFEPYYEETVLEEETDPNIIYDIKNSLMEYRVYSEIDIESFSKVFYSNKVQTSKDTGKLHSYIKPALDRFTQLEEEKQYVFKSTLVKFNRMYEFITQICRLFDREIHKFSVYSRFLYNSLPKGVNDNIFIDDKVFLEYYKLEKDFEGEINLEPVQEGFRAISGESGKKETKIDPLTVIINKINEKYGYNFTEMDKILKQIENDYISEEKWRDYAKSTDLKTFMLLLKKDFNSMISSRYEQNSEFFIKLLSDENIKDDVFEELAPSLYSKLKNKE